MSRPHVQRLSGVQDTLRKALPYAEVIIPVAAPQLAPLAIASKALREKAKPQAPVPTGDTETTKGAARAAQAAPAPSSKSGPAPKAGGSALAWGTALGLLWWLFL